MKLFFLLALTGLLSGQQPPVFEVASIKPNTSGAPGSGAHPRNGGMEYQNYSLQRLIQTAYRVKDYAYAGPSWLDSVHFDVIAKMPAGAKYEQLPEMLQALLEERFKLAVHREEKEMPGLALVVDKGGLRIHPVEPGAGGTSWGPSMVGGSRISLAIFADLLSNAVNRPVKDLTETSGVYDIEIHWLPDGPPPADSLGTPNSVYAAVQELGLKLQVQKLRFQTLVVDHADRAPTEN